MSSSTVSEPKTAYNPQNEMFSKYKTKRYFPKNEMSFFKGLFYIKNNQK